MIDVLKLVACSLASVFKSRAPKGAGQATGQRRRPVHLRVALPAAPVGQQPLLALEVSLKGGRHRRSPKVAAF
jgi:hypothetical protein